MGVSLRIKLFLCVIIACSTVVESDRALVRQKRFISLFADSARIIASGIQQQADILNQGIQNKKAILSQVPTMVQQTSQAIKASVLLAAEIPATVATNLLINGANAYIVFTKKETLELPNISSSVFGFGRLIANGGKLRNLATLTLNGQVKLQKSGLSLLIDVPVKLRNLTVEYGNYSFSTWGINLEGNIKATISKNAFLIMFHLLGSANCTINVRRVEVQTLEDVKVELQGSHASFLKTATDYIATFLQNVLKTEVQKALDQQISAYVNNNSKLICSSFAQLNTL